MTLSIHEMRVELIEAGHQEGTELGEYWLALCELFHFTEMMNTELFDAYYIEMERVYNWVKENSEWVEEVEVVKTRKTKHLRFNF